MNLLLLNIIQGKIKKDHALIILICLSNSESRMDTSLTNESAWTYFSGKEGSKSEYFQDHFWPVYLLFGILAIGALCNMFLVSTSNHHVEEYKLYDISQLHCLKY